MNFDLKRTVSANSDSDCTQNSVDSVENGKHCIVKFRHRDFTFERQVFLDCRKRMPTSPIKSPVSAKKICLQPNPNVNNLDVSVSRNDQNIERIRGVINLASLFEECFINLSVKDLITIAYDIDISCTRAATEQIEIETRHRLSSAPSDKESLWQQLQVGRICGSVFKNVCHSESKYPSQLLSRIYQQSAVDDLSINWFKKNFLTVRTKYERIMLNRHKNFVYRRCGLILRSEHPQFCVTPGGFVECDCCGRGLTELYLPYHIRNRKMIYTLSCLGETDDYDFTLRNDSSFYYKLQLHMFLTDTSYCDFVIWTSCDYESIRVQRDDEFLFVKVNTAKSFFLRKIMPNLLSKRISGF